MGCSRVRCPYLQLRASSLALSPRRSVLTDRCIARSYTAVVRSGMKRDLQTTAFSSVLLLKQVFEQAERSDDGWTLATNLPATEDIALLDAVEQWDQSVHGSSGSAPPLLAKAAVESRAPPSRSLRPVGQAQDPRLVADLQGARDDNASLQERFQRMQVQTSTILREKSALQAQVEAMQAAAGMSDEAEALRAQVDELQLQLQDALNANAAQADQGTGTDSLMRELHEAQDANAQLTADLDRANAELDARLERSTQFVNLRQVGSERPSTPPCAPQRGVSSARPLPRCLTGLPLRLRHRLLRLVRRRPPIRRCSRRRMTW